MIALEGCLKLRDEFLNEDGLRKSHRRDCRAIYQG